MGCADFVLDNLKELWWIDCTMEKHKIEPLVSFLKLCPYFEKMFIIVGFSCRFLIFVCQLLSNDLYILGKIGSWVLVGTKQTRAKRVRIENIRRRVLLEHKEKSLSNALIENLLRCQ